MLDLKEKNTLNCVSLAVSQTETEGNPMMACQINFDQALTDKLTICTLNIKMGSDRDELKAFLQETNFKDSIVCLQEFRDDRDLMELLDHLKDTKSMFAYCARSSHSHCAVLSTLPLQEVKN